MTLEARTVPSSATALFPFLAGPLLTSNFEVRSPKSAVSDTITEAAEVGSAVTAIKTLDSCATLAITDADLA